MFVAPSILSTRFFLWVPSVDEPKGGNFENCVATPKIFVLRSAQYTFYAIFFSGFPDSTNPKGVISKLRSAQYTFYENFLWVPSFYEPKRPKICTKNLRDTSARSIANESNFHAKYRESGGRKHFRDR